MNHARTNRTFHVHYVEGNGLEPRDTPRRTVDLDAPSENVLLATLATVERLVKGDRAHSVTVFDTTNGRRDNVTELYTGFDSVPRRPVGILGKDAR